MATTETDRMRFLERAAELELNMGRLYSLFYRLFPEDADLWWQLSIEERNHSALLESGMTFLENGLCAHEFLHHNMDGLVRENEHINELIRGYEKNSPSRKEALHMAYCLENSTYELHFQQARR